MEQVTTEEARRLANWAALKVSDWEGPQIAAALRSLTAERDEYKDDAVGMSCDLSALHGEMELLRERLEDERDAAVARAEEAESALRRTTQERDIWSHALGRAALAFQAKDMEEVRKLLCDMDAKSYAYRAFHEDRSERDRYRAALAEFYRRLERDARASVTEGCMYLFGAVPLDVVEAARDAARGWAMSEWTPDDPIVKEWRAQLAEAPIKHCGRLDMATYMPDEVSVGRVTSDRVRYVYFEDGSEVICLGNFCDHVAFRAADYDSRDAEIARLRSALAKIGAQEVVAGGFGGSIVTEIPAEVFDLAVECAREVGGE